MNPKAHFTAASYRSCLFLFCSMLMPFGMLLAQEENMLAPDEEAPGKTIEIEIGPNTDFSLGGALWLRGATLNWEQRARANREGLYVDQFRLAIDGEHGLENKTKLKFGVQVRWWTYQFAVTRMWFGININEHHDVQVGVFQTPFGALPSISPSFWFSQNYYVGLEGELDAGIKYSYRKKGWQLDVAYMANDEYNAPGAINRFAPDLHTSEEQQNFEQHQGNIRVAYTFGYDTRSTTEIGISGQLGQMPNQTTEKNGNRWAAAAHYIGNYGDWNINLQGARYEFNPKNPEGVDDRTVLIAFFSDRRLVAAKATTLAGSVRRFFDIDWWLFKHANVYVEYSAVVKDESSFNSTEVINPGGVLNAGPFYLWLDVMWGRNAWWFNDSEANSGPGAGSLDPNTWELRFNLSLQWYF